MDRVILHCDMNSFFASVELLEHPKLKDKPVAVCGDPDSRHGIILAKNEPAKKYLVYLLAGAIKMSGFDFSSASYEQIQAVFA